MAYKGTYTPKNRKKYRGNSSNIVWRSLWERRFMRWCDENPNVITWSSEELSIPYLCPTDRRNHRYFPDFYMKVKTKTNKYEEYIIEVKPKKQLKPPKKPKSKKTKGYMYESFHYMKNTAKWDAAKRFCKKRNWTFKIITEDQLLP